MGDPRPPARSIADHQEHGFGAAHDYDRGSPHLRHAPLRDEIGRRLDDLVQRSGGAGCRVLEVGAGHGRFTDRLLEAGAVVTLTEMSRPSHDALVSRFAGDDRVRCLHDPDGEEVFRDGATFDLVVCLSLLHHVPDYEGFVRRLIPQIRAGGSFASFQDPLWYPRQGRGQRAADRGAYFAWRLGQPDLLGGAKTRLRRLRGIRDEANPADMVEYHVVRDGVDEAALGSVLREGFGAVELWTYWSTQGPRLQRLGARLGWANTFGLVALDRQARG